MLEKPYKPRPLTAEETEHIYQVEIALKGMGKSSIQHACSGISMPPLNVSGSLPYGVDLGGGCIVSSANVPHQPRAAQEQSENVPLSGALAECDGSDMSSVFISALKIANQATDDYLQKHSQLKQ